MIKSYVIFDKGGKYKCHCNLPQYFNRRKSMIKITMVIYGSIFLQYWHYLLFLGLKYYGHPLPIHGNFQGNIAL
jgi:hypothetical protein